MSMINLMPPSAKDDIIYARRNRTIFRWCAIGLTTIAAMGVVVVFGGIYIDHSKSNLKTSIDSTQASISSQKLDQVQKQANNLSSGVKLIVQILSKEVQFSKLLQQIGTMMPDGAILGDIQLSNEVSGALDLNANALDLKTATQVQVNLQDPKNPLFDKVDTINVNCSDKSTLAQSSSSSDSTGSSASNTDTPYLCQITLRALFKPNAAVTFLAVPAAGSTNTKTITGSTKP
jgi:hypothetical protein